MNIDPERIRQFCEQAKESGALKAAFTAIQREIFLEWALAEDASKRDELWHTMQALERFQNHMENFAAIGPSTDPEGLI